VISLKDFVGHLKRVYLAALDAGAKMGSPRGPGRLLLPST